jgi:hypothetical protein
MSEHASENERNDVAPGSASPGPPVDPTPDDVVAPVPQDSPGPPVVPGDDDGEDRPTEDDKAIPGEYPEDNPDLEGEDRFDAG